MAGTRHISQLVIPLITPGRSCLGILLTESSKSGLPICQRVTKPTYILPIVKQSQRHLHQLLRNTSSKYSHGQVRRLLRACRSEKSVAITARWQSSAILDENTPSAAANSLPDGYIPDVPPIPDLPATEEIASQALNALGEPTLQSLGLCNWTPPGFFQWGLEALHVNLDLPWVGAIVLATVTIRLCILPLVIRGQRNAVKMHNHMPTIQRLNERFQEAKTSGNMVEAMKAMNDLKSYTERNKVEPFKALLMPMVQAPIFFSVFIGMRKMANLPVESMKTGGALWFPDLTIADPYFILPVMTAVTLLITLESGAEGINMAVMGPAARTAMRILPAFVCFFTMNFPAALCAYWLTSNIISLLQMQVFKQPSVRKYLDIEERVKHPVPATKKKGFVEGFRESWSSSKQMANYERRREIDAENFQKAGQGPVVKTYKYNPKTNVNKSKKFLDD